MIKYRHFLNRFGRHFVSKTNAVSASPGRHTNRLRCPLVEQLEPRNMLSTITWGAVGGGDFNTAGNWVGGHVPGASDDAVINVAGNVTITYSSGTTSVHSINSTDTLSISGGALTLTSGSSVISGGLTISGGTVTATGGATSLTISGAAAFNGGNITAAAGATVAFPNLTSFQGPTNDLVAVTLEATGAGSILDLSHITSLVGRLPSLHPRPILKRWPVAMSNSRPCRVFLDRRCLNRMAPTAR